MAGIVTNYGNYRVAQSQGTRTIQLISKMGGDLYDTFTEWGGNMTDSFGMGTSIGGLILIVAFY